MGEAEIYAGLNDEQRRAVEAVRGPVCILAGAGSGKTTTITRRIANQVWTNAFAPGEILAVTFTDRAAGEMRARLGALGVEGVRARTFHSAALAQLRNLGNDAPAQILPSKVVALRQIANTLPKPYRFRPAADLATEIEWAKNRRIDATGYLSAAGGHEPPIPKDLMASVYKRYESGKQQRNLIDFEDLLELTIQMFHNDEWAREQFAARYRAFTVDEYQDVNLLQETLLRAWIGERDDLCVVGDDYQSIYGFTGASPDYLLAMPTRFPKTAVIRLETNYRSTPEVLGVANRLVPKLGGAEKVLRAVKDGGTQPLIRTFTRPDAELKFLVERIKVLQAEGVPLEEMVVLYRVNFRSEDYEEILSAEAIPYQVGDGAFLKRATARQMLSMLQRSSSTSVAADVRKLAEKAGYLEELPDGLGEQEITRQNDLGRFIRFAEEFDDGTRTAADFAADIQERFGGEGQGRGVNLLSFHRAKGLEFEAVFLPRVEDGELPFRRARSAEATAEERRLFYVGITRAKTHLAITSVNDGKRKASAFIGELREAGAAATGPIGSPAKRPAPAPEVIHAAIDLEIQVSGGFGGRIVELDDDGATIAIESGAQVEVPFGERVSAGGKTLALGPPQTQDDTLLEGLKRWRRERAKADEVPAYVVFHDSTLQEIVARRPRTPEDLAEIPGVGPTKLERYAQEILKTLETSLSPAAH